MPEALRIKLSREDIDAIHEVAPLHPRFPMGFLYMFKTDQKYDLTLTAANSGHYHMGAWIDTPPKNLVSTAFPSTTTYS